MYHRTTKQHKANVLLSVRSINALYDTKNAGSAKRGAGDTERGCGGVISILYINVYNPAPELKNTVSSAL